MAKRRPNYPKGPIEDKYHEFATDIKTDKEDIICKVREKGIMVRIRSGPGTNYDHVNGEYLGKGVFEIDQKSDGVGSMSGWGHLVNGKGWVALDFVEIVP